MTAQQRHNPRTAHPVTDDDTRAKIRARRAARQTKRDTQPTIEDWVGAFETARAQLITAYMIAVAAETEQDVNKHAKDAIAAAFKVLVNAYRSFGVTPNDGDDSGEPHQETNGLPQPRSLAQYLTGYVTQAIARQPDFQREPEASTPEPQTEKVEGADQEAAAPRRESDQGTKVMPAQVTAQVALISQAAPLFPEGAERFQQQLETSLRTFASPSKSQPIVDKFATALGTIGPHHETDDRLLRKRLESIVNPRSAKDRKEFSVAETRSPRSVTKGTTPDPVADAASTNLAGTEHVNTDAMAFEDLARTLLDLYRLFAEASGTQNKMPSKGLMHCFLLTLETLAVHGTDQRTTVLDNAYRRKQRYLTIKRRRQHGTSVDDDTATTALQQHFVQQPLSSTDVINLAKQLGHDTAKDKIDTPDGAKTKTELLLSEPARNLINETPSFKKLADEALVSQLGPMIEHADKFTTGRGGARYTIDWIDNEDGTYRIDTQTNCFHKFAVRNQPNFGSITKLCITLYQLCCIPPEARTAAALDT